MGFWPDTVCFENKNRLTHGLRYQLQWVRRLIPHFQAPGSSCRCFRSQASCPLPGRGWHYSYTQSGQKQCTMQIPYNAVKVPPNRYNRHPIARPQWRAMGYLLCEQTLICLLSESRHIDIGIVIVVVVSSLPSFSSSLLLSSLLLSSLLIS